MHKITERNCQHDFYSKKRTKILLFIKKKLFLQMTIVIQIKTLGYHNERKFLLFIN